MAPTVGAAQGQARTGQESGEPPWPWRWEWVAPAWALGPHKCPLRPPRRVHRGSEGSHGSGGSLYQRQWGLAIAALPGDLGEVSGPEVRLQPVLLRQFSQL